MKNTYKLNFIYQFKSIRESLFYLAFLCIAFSLFTFFIDGSHYTEIIVFAVIFWCITSFIFVLPLHIHYLRANWNTELIVDDFLKRIKIKQNGHTYSYKFSEFRTLRYLGSNFKSGKKKFHKDSTISNYAYVKIKTIDKKTFIITSLMTDPFDFPLEINNTQNGLQFIKPDLTNQDREVYKTKVNDDNEEKIIRFMNLFQSLSTEELYTKLEKRSTLVKEATLAIERILHERT